MTASPVPALGQEIISQTQSMELLRTTYRTELDVLMEQAKMYPRDMIKRLDEAKIIACSSVEVAEACFYKKPVGRVDPIEGPSVRLAEIIAMCWGNMMIDVRTQMITDTEVICRGMGMDCQTCFGVSVETRISILYSQNHDDHDKRGQRYPDHLITTTALAGCSIAYRNTIFRLVPTALVQPVYQAVKAAAIGEGDKFEKRRKEVIERLQTNLGISTARILLSVKAEEIEEIMPNQLETLIGFGTAIHNGDVATEEVFPPPGASASAELSKKLKQGVPKGGKPKSDEARQIKGGQGLAPSASSEPSGFVAELNPSPETAEPQKQGELEEVLNGALNGHGDTSEEDKAPPILDQMIDWFAAHAGGIKSHEAFVRLQNYAKTYIDNDANIQQMSDRALSAYWLHLKKADHTNVQ